MQPKISSSLLVIIFIYSISILAQSASENKNLNDKKYFVSDNQKQFDILRYNLKLDLYPDDKILSGIAVITAFKKLDPALCPELELNLYDNMEVRSVSLNQQNTEYRRKNNRIFIQTDGFLTDTFTVEIKYEGTPKRGGFDGFVFGEVKGNSLIYNISEPNFASTWFPCDDDPSDKALLDIEIANDSQYISVSNGNLKNVKVTGSKKTYHYQTVYPISTYLVSVYSASYKTYYDIYKGLNGNDSMNIEYYVMPEHFDKAKIDFAEHLES